MEKCLCFSTRRKHGDRHGFRQRRRQDRHLAHKGWTWFHRWQYGRITVSPPPTFVPAGWVKLHGTHNKPNGTFWLVTCWDEKVWPQARLVMESDGTWAGTVNTNPDPKPRKCFVLLVRTDQLVDSYFRRYQSIGQKLKNWDALQFNPKLLDIVQEIVLQVAPAPILSGAKN